MLNVTPILRYLAKRRSAFLSSSSPIRLQEEQLLSLLRKAKDTKFGRDHGFSDITSVRDYQKRVPIRRYENFWNEYWKEFYPRLENVTWPGLIPYFSLSSGTSSGTTKYIPCSQEMLASNTKAGLDLLFHHVLNRPHSKLMGGKSFMLGGSTDLTTPTPGVFCGDLSGIAVKTLPWWARARYFPPQELALIKNWEEKVDTLSALSLKEDIRMISGVPAWLLIFFDKLTTILSEGKKSVADAYPNLEMIVHGGVNFAPYLHRFQEALRGTHAELREVYPASEGFVAVADRGYGEGLRLHVDVGIFFEFIPVEEVESSSPTRLTLSEVEVDKNYALVMTTCAGLWSYLIGDTVKFVELSPPRILITGRVSYYLSAFGEHLIADEIEDGVVSASQTIQKNVVDYSVGPVFPESAGELGGHVYVVEFEGAPPSPPEQEKFLMELDHQLCKRNEDYEAHRSKGFGLKAPILEIMPKGGFALWMKSRGKMGGQNKVPRIITDLTLFKNLREFVCSPSKPE
jgi:hypothetical protein